MGMIRVHKWPHKVLLVILLVNLNLRGWNSGFCSRKAGGVGSNYFLHINDEKSSKFGLFHVFDYYLISENICESSF